VEFRSVKPRSVDQGASGCAPAAVDRLGRNARNTVFVRARRL